MRWFLLLYRVVLIISICKSDFFTIPGRRGEEWQQLGATDHGAELLPRRLHVDSTSNWGAKLDAMTRGVEMMRTRGVDPDLSMREGWITRFGHGDDVHGPTTATQGCRALATDTPPPTVATILWSATTSHEGTCPTSNRKTSKNK